MDTQKPNDPELAGDFSLPSSEMTIRKIKSHELFSNMNEVEIDHEGRIYRLRLTRFNKLILTA